MKDLHKFIAGFTSFKAKYFGSEQSLFAKLRKSQHPSALVVSCCDSRVDPAILTGADPGDLFVIRNVANLVPPYRHETQAPGIRAAIEFAIKGLNVEHIIVLGHSGCSGIQALMDADGTVEQQYEFIASWVSIAKYARDTVLHEHAGESPEDQAKACGKAAIMISLTNLLSFPWVKQRVDAGTLALHGWYFDIDAGELLGYSEKEKAFAPLVAGSV